MDPRSKTHDAPQGLRAYPIVTCIGAAVVGLICWIAASPDPIQAADPVRDADGGWSVFRAPEPIHLETPKPGERQEVWESSTEAAAGSTTILPERAGDLLPPDPQDRAVEGSTPAE